MQNFSFRRLAVNTIFLSAGRWTAQILNVIFVPVVLAYISPSDFGVFSVFQVAALIGGVVMSLGLSTVFISQFGNSQGDSENLLGRTVGQQVVFGGVLLALMLALSKPLTIWLANDQSMLLLPLFFLGEYFANMVLIINRWQILTNRHWQLGLGAVSKSVAQFILLLVFVIWGRYGLLGLVISELGSKIISFLVVFLLSCTSWKFEFRKSDIGVVYKLGLPAAPDTIFFWLLLFLPLYLLKQHGYLILAGAFSLGWRLLSPVELLGNSLASAAAEKILDKKSDRLSLNRWHRLSVFAILFSSLCLLFFSVDILHLLFKPEYAQVLPLLPVMAIGILFLSFYYFEWISISGSRRTYGLSLASGGGVLLLLIGVFFVRDMINGLSVTVLFSLGFFAMWLIARGLNTVQKLGYSPYLLVSVILTAITGSFMSLFPTSWLGIVVKALILGCIVLSAGIAELIIRLRERKMIEDRPGSFLEIPNYAEIAKKVGSTSPILDIGCSEGFFLGDIKTTGLKVGVETDFERLKIGHLERNGVNFVCADASNLPFRQGSFETVVLIGVLPYLDQPLGALKEVHRVLNKNGRVEISAANSYWFNRYINIYSWKHKVRFYKSFELENFMNDSGFALKSIYTRGWFIAPLLGNFFIIPNIIDRLAGNTHSVLGPCARWARAVTNPLIQWEYDHHIGDGYQSFASGVRND